MAKGLFIAHLPFALLFGRCVAFGLRCVALQFGKELLLVHRVADDVHDQHREQLREQVVVGQTAGVAVEPAEHHDRHQIEGHELHTGHLRTCRCGLLVGHARIEEQSQRREQGEQAHVVAVEGDLEGQLQYAVVGGEVLGPQEALAAQLDGGRQEAEHRDEDGHLDQHRDAASHGTHAAFAVELHDRLLFAERIFLVGIAFVDLVELRLEYPHLCGRHVRLVGQRQDDQFDDDRQDQDDDTVIPDKFAEPVEYVDRQTGIDPADEASAQRNDLLQLQPVGVHDGVLVGAEVVLEAVFVLVGMVGDGEGRRELLDLARALFPGVEAHCVRRELFPCDEYR